jgi:hypothetical protein
MLTMGEKVDRKQHDRTIDGAGALHRRRNVETHLASLDAGYNSHRA